MFSTAFEPVNNNNSAAVYQLNRW